MNHKKYFTKWQKSDTQHIYFIFHLYGVLWESSYRNRILISGYDRELGNVTQENLLYNKMFNIQIYTNAHVSKFKKWINYTQ